VQLYRYFVSQSSEFCRHNPFCCFSTSVYCCCCCFLIRYRLSPETFGYTLVLWKSTLSSHTLCADRPLKGWMKLTMANRFVPERDVLLTRCCNYVSWCWILLQMDSVSMHVNHVTASTHWHTTALRSMVQASVEPSQSNGESDILYHFLFRC